MEVYEVFSKEWYEGYFASKTKECFESLNYDHCPYPIDTSKWEDWCKGYEAEDCKPIQIYMHGTSSGIGWSTESC